MKKTTIRDIANEAGVSVALVSFVMSNQSRSADKVYKVNETTSRRILEIARRLDYRPNKAARTLRSGKTNTIGVVLSDISNKFFADIARCIEDRAYGYDCTVIFGSTDENAGKLENLVKVFMDKGVDGLIVVPCVGSERFIRSLADSDLPLVLMDRECSGVNTSRVMLNNGAALSLAVSALADNGYSKIEMIAYDMRLSNIVEREAGYRSKMEEYGLSDNVAIHRIPYKDIYGQIREVVVSALARGVEAFVFATNTLTIAGLKVLSDLGVTVPEKVRIVGFDDSEAFELYGTSITYVSQPVEQFGIRALDLLMEHISGGDPLSRKTVMLQPRLVVGNSSQ